MELILNRKIKTDKSTIGELSINGVHECYILEDVDRGLKSDMPIKEISKLKIHGVTAIPKGRYKIIITWSNRFKKQLPLLVNVLGFAGIRIHSGNAPKDTEGCLLPGTAYSKDFVSESKIAFNKLFDKIKIALLKEEVFIIING